MKRVEDKVCIVSGAASGVGREDALLLAGEGARVVLTDLNEEAGRTLAAEIGEQALFVRQDIASEADWQNLIKLTLERFGRLDVLVNNAGIGTHTSLLESDVERMAEMITLNVTALTRLTYAAIPGFTARKHGAVINISSIVSLAPELLNGVM